MDKFTTTELIIYLDRIEGPQDIYGDGDSKAHEPETMEIKKRLIELDILKEEKEMTTIFNQEHDGSIDGFAGDLKVFVGAGDFKSAMILLNNLRKYILEIKKNHKEVK